ncbi:hypothetical protein HaLaN_04564 [Haematococcus lacustris]|uniref:Uncharacterized protein n=1 Tax=Haematococcus lacustris TaxID=44745 RepID=A0A699YR77_HAELA|nr:hypothetical protein HaLaN_04564 [Haematococcus lacustris]
MEPRLASPLQKRAHMPQCKKATHLKAALERPIAQNVTVRVPGRLPVTVGASSSGAQASVTALACASECYDVVQM